MKIKEEEESLILNKHTNIILMPKQKD